MFPKGQTPTWEMHFASTPNSASQPAWPEVRFPLNKRRNKTLMFKGEHVQGDLAKWKGLFFPLSVMEENCQEYPLLRNT